MVFHQPNWDVRGDVYNTAGDLILTKTSTREDLAKALIDLKAELAAIGDIPDDDRRLLEQEADAAAADAKRPEVPKEQVVSRLDRIRERLSALGGVASGALDLAKTVAAIAGWVALL